MEETFPVEFKKALENMIPKQTDDYRTVKYSDTLYVQVWSHDDGEGHFELYVIVPHDEVSDVDLVSESWSVLSEEIEGVEELYEKLDDLLYEVTGKEYNYTLQLSEVVDDGTLDRHSSSYFSSKLTHPDYE
jgi:hypothetical protein